MKNRETEAQREVNRSIAAVVPTVAWDATVPIVVAIDGEVRHHGTGTLFQVADHHFLFTAAHVFEAASRESKSLGIGGSDDGRFIALEGTAFSSSARLDVALHRLGKSAVSRLSRKTFLQLNDVEFAEPSQTAVYTVFGFPAILTISSVSSDEPLSLKALEFTSYAFDRDSSMCDGYDSTVHILIDAQHRGTTDEDGQPVSFDRRDGRQAAFPKDLPGISGCSVWRVGDLHAHPDRWSETRPRVVAVQTSVYSSKRAIKATRWVAVSTLIHEVFPELRPALNLWRLA